VPENADEQKKVEIDLLGTVRLRIGGDDVAPLPRKVRAVLAYLVIRRGDKIPRETLAGLFWGDRADEQAHASLRQTLSQIRKTLRPAGATLVTADRESVQFTAGNLHIDLEELIRLKDSEDIDALARFLDGVHGELLEGMSIGESAFEQWLATEREAVRRQLIAALSRLAELYEVKGVFNDSINVNLRVLAYDALDEETYRTLMRLFMAQGRYDAAMSQFETCRGRLEKELGVEPAPETIALWNRAKARRRGSETAIKTVTVRAFNVAGDDSTEFLAEGLREGLFNSLDKQSAIGVVREQGPSQGKATFALEGSVRGLRNRLRMTFRLIETASNNQIWSERYDRESDDLFELEAEISRTVAAFIRTKVKEAFFNSLRDARDDDLTVPELLDKAAAFATRGLASDERSIAALRSALARDPGNSMANAMLAYFLLERFEYTPLDLPAASRNEIAQLAVRAVELQANSYWAQYVAGTVAQDIFGDFDRALRHAQVALHANPDFAAALGVTGIVKCHSGDPAAGIEILKQTINSTSPNTSFREERELAIAYLVNGDVGAAVGLIGRLVDRDPRMDRNRLLHAALLWLNGDADNAMAAGSNLKKKYSALSIVTKRPIQIGPPDVSAKFEEAMASVGL